MQVPKLLTVKDVMVVPGHDLQCREGGADASVNAVVDLHCSNDFTPMWGVTSDCHESGG